MTNAEWAIGKSYNLSVRQTRDAISYIVDMYLTDKQKVKATPDMCLEFLKDLAIEMGYEVIHKPAEYFIVR